MYLILNLLVAFSVVLPILALISVVLRFYARSFRGLEWLSDDWLVLVAWVLCATTSALNMYAVLRLGLGTPPMSHTPDQIVSGYKVVYATIILDYVAYCIIKISVIQFYKRIFTMGGLIKWANILIILVTAWTIGGTLAHAFASTPVSNFWVGKFTIDWPKLNYIMAALDVLFDIAVLLLPLIPIKELKVSRKKKFSLIGLFWLGSLCTVASLMRIYYAYEFSIFGPNTTEDWMRYVTSSTNLWLVVEGNVCIIAACLPTLGGLIRMKIPSMKSTVRSSNHLLSVSSPDNRRRSMRPFGGDTSAWVTLDAVSAKSDRALARDPEAQIHPSGAIQVSTTISQSHVKY